MHGNVEKGLDDNLPFQAVVGFFFADLFRGFSKKSTSFDSGWAWFSCCNIHSNK
jgi:hypothetical protein